MSEDLPISIRRNGELLGAWGKFEIRQFLASGPLLVTDEALDPETNSWLPLLPPYRRRYSLFDWADEDDLMFYYYRDGYIHGPRTPDEIDALVDAGFLTDSHPVTLVGSDQWWRLGELLNDESDDGHEEAGEPEDVSHLIAARDHVLSGNFKAAAVNAGFHLLFSSPKKGENRSDSQDEVLE